MPATYTLDNGLDLHREFPDTFWIPPQGDRESLCPGDLVKLIFRIEFDDEAHVERMWVKVTEVGPGSYVGVLDNDPFCTDEIRHGMRVEFHSDHVIQIDRAFTVHWSQIPHAAEGMALFALWPSPVNDDVCFREAGFTDFGDSDESWDAEADLMLTRLLEVLGGYGTPRLVSEPARMQRSWYHRLFGKVEAEAFDLRQQIELPIQWDSLADCIVAFGEAGVSLRTGSGHHIFWITLPGHDAASYPNLVSQVAASHPVVRTDLRWECLV